MLKADNLELTTDITCRYKYAKCFKFFRHTVQEIRKGVHEYKNKNTYVRYKCCYILRPVCYPLAQMVHIQMSMLVHETGKCIGKMCLQKIKKSLSEIIFWKNFDHNWSCFLANCFIIFWGVYLFLDWKNLILLTFVFF